MTPQFVDLNADGYKDIIAATFMGEVFIVQGGRDGYAEPKNLVDRKGDNIRISLYWDNDESDYLHVNRSLPGEKNNKDHHLTSVAVVDWDNDKDLDLILGAYEGALYLCENEGDAATPKFSTKNQQIKVSGKSISIGGGLATPRVCDWNGDGKFDLLCGTSDGQVLLYANKGKIGSPEFAKAELLVQRPSQGAVSVGVEMDDYFSSRMAPVVDGKPAGPCASFHIETVDYDKDGDLDLLVGGSCYIASKKKVLAKKERAKLRRLQVQSASLEQEMEKFFDEDMDQEQLEEVFSSSEVQELYAKVEKIEGEIEELSPMPKELDRVWLYRNNRGGQSTRVKAKPSESFDDAVQSTEPEVVPGGVLSIQNSSGLNDASLTTSIDIGPVLPGQPMLLTVNVRIPDGLHIYGSKNASTPTKLTIIEDAGLVVEKDAQVPAGRVTRFKGKKSYWLTGDVSLKQELIVPKDFKSGVLKGQVGFTMCDEQTCRPPENVKFEIEIKATKK